MATPFNGLSPGSPPDQQQRLQKIIDFWNSLSCRADAGETTWGVLEELQAKVSECLACEPSDLKKAESLTAQAALLMSGRLLV
ncbi:MAG: hypothetical protein U0840_28530 [Gemmataceae bacterium]